MAQGKVLFTAVEDEKLVDMVSKFPCVYDAESPVYKNQNIKENAWKEIAAFVDRTAQDCKKRWRNIKDTHQKRQKKGKGTGSSVSSQGKKWILADMLTFLGKVDHKRESISNIESDDTEVDNVPDDECTAMDVADASPTSPSTSDAPTQNVDIAVDSLRPSNNRQRHNDKIIELMEARRIERQDIINTINQNRDDEVDLFFKSVAMSVKKLRPDLINEAKMRALQIVFELEYRNSQEFSMPPAPVPSPSPSSGAHATSPSLVSNYSTHETSTFELP